MAWSQWHRSVDPFLAVPCAQPRWLIEGLVPGSGLTLLQALPKVGKSILAWQMAEALALGEPFLDLPTAKARTAYLQLDEPVPEWQAQLEQIEAKDAPVLLPSDPVPYPLADPIATLAVRAALDAHAIEVVVVDAFKDLAITDPNTAEGIQRTLLGLARLIGSRPCILIHHVRKPLAEAEDDPVVATAGHHTLAAGASMILHLRPRGLMIGGGRLAQRRTLPLARSETGRWIAAGALPV